MADQEQSQPSGEFVVGVVGPCSSGKSTLVRELRKAGYTVREIRQEHSVAPKMWKLFANPDLLIYLDVSMDAAAQREGLDQPSSWWAEEREVRLAHARAHCDLYVDTTDLTPDVVVARVLRFLEDAADV